MDRWARGCIGMLLSSLAACGPAAEPPAHPTTASPLGSAEPTDDAAPKSAYQRKRQIARTKREQCLALGNAIQQAQQQDIILNVNDSKAMLRIATSLESSAGKITAACADLDQLRQLRDDYAGNLHEMATALTRASAAKGERERKPSIDRFHDSEGRTGQLLERLNEFCNAPVD